MIAHIHRLQLLICVVLLCACNLASAQIKTTEHIISAPSLAPALPKQTTQLYLRELKATNTKPTKAVLFIHGGGTPAEVAFDVPYQDYSWMAYLAQQGLAVYALDLTGYGRSTRPSEMNDLCHLSAQAQEQFIPTLIPKLCNKIYSQALTSNESDWADIDAAINFIRAREKNSAVALIGWSQGATRSLSYVLHYPNKVNRLILFAPAYGRDWPLTQAAPYELTRLMGAQTQAEFTKGWNKQIGCKQQVDDAIRPIIWREMLASDKQGARWGSGIRRAPEQDWRWGFNRSTAASIHMPTLLISGEFDTQVPATTVRELYADLASPQKVLLELGCSSHFAAWETNHHLLFKASAEWLQQNSVEGQSTGTLKLGYRRP